MTGHAQASVSGSVIFSLFRSFKTFRKLASCAAAVTGVLLLASCAGGGVPEPSVGVAGDPYAITDVDVVIAKGVYYGADMADGSSPQELAKQVQAALKKRLTEDLVHTKTSKMPARLEVVLDAVNMSSALGRTMLKSDSKVGGHLALVDKRTKKVISRYDQFYITDDSIKVYGSGSGTAGGIAVIAALAVNAAQSSDEDRIASVVGPFALGVKRWLGRAGD
jgi:hypothetical protein